MTSLSTALRATVGSWLGGGAGIGRLRQEGAQGGPPPLSVDVAAATRQNIATYLTLDGQIAPQEQSTLAFQQSGTIIKIDVNIGDLVEKAAARARSTRRRCRRSSRRRRHRQRRRGGGARRGRRAIPCSRKRINAAVQTAKASLDNAKLVYEQNKQLFKQGYVSQTALQQSQATYVSGAANV